MCPRKGSGPGVFSGDEVRKKRGRRAVIVKNRDGAGLAQTVRVRGVAMASARKTDDGHARRDSGDDARDPVLDHYALGRRNTELLGNVKKQVGRRLSPRHAIGGIDMRREGVMQPGDAQGVMKGVRGRPGGYAAPDSAGATRKEIRDA